MPRIISPGFPGARRRYLRFPGAVNASPPRFNGFPCQFPAYFVTHSRRRLPSALAPFPPARGRLSPDPPGRPPRTSRACPCWAARLTPPRNCALHGTGRAVIAAPVSLSIPAPISNSALSQHQQLQWLLARHTSAATPSLAFGNNVMLHQKSSVRCRWQAQGHDSRTRTGNSYHSIAGATGNAWQQCAGQGDVMTAAAMYDKLNEHRRIFNTLLSTLIQDMARGRVYYIRAEDLAEFSTIPASWAFQNDSTVSFVIPDGEFSDKISSFLRTPDVDPCILVRYRRGSPPTSRRSQTFRSSRQRSQRRRSAPQTRSVS
jgi:hypothetical protein